VLVVGLSAPGEAQGRVRYPARRPIEDVHDSHVPLFVAQGAIRTQEAPETLVNAVRRELLNATNLPPADIRTMDDIVQSATALMALIMWLMTAFAGLALLLAVDWWGPTACLLPHATRTEDPSGPIGQRVDTGRFVLSVV
jgi:hypothetical protein